MRTYVLIKVVPGKERRISEDLEDFLYPYDQSVRVHRTPYHGLIILESYLESEEILNLLKKSRVGYLRGLVVLDGLVSVSNWTEVVEIISMKIPRGSEVSLKVKVRGESQRLKELMDVIRSEIVRRGYVIREGARFTVSLETLDDIIGIVIGNI